MAEPLGPALLSRPRADADAVQQLLRVVRTQLGMQAAYTSEFVEGAQVFRFVDAEPGVRAPQPGASVPLSRSYCGQVLSGKMPALIPDARTDPVAALVPLPPGLVIGAYVGVPLLSPEGDARGMLCATSTHPRPELAERDLAALRLTAALLQDLQSRALSDAARQEEQSGIRRRLAALVAGRGRSVVLQPLVEARTGRVVAHEALSRFGPGRSPAEWFSAAGACGMTAELEVAAARTALALLRAPAVDVLSLNLSASTVLGGALSGLLDGVDPRAVVLELTEHEPVDDYAALRAALAPWRARGVRLAVDDAGAGYASLRHVMQLSPDLVKVDTLLVRDVDLDPAKQALLRSLVLFAADTGCGLVAEGVETEGERAALTALGVDLLQGYLLGRPAAVDTVALPA